MPAEVGPAARFARPGQARARTRWGAPTRIFSLAAATEGLQALTQGLVEDCGGGGGDVERGQPAPHREADRGVAETPRAGPQPLFLAAKAKDHLAGEVQLPGGLPVRVGTVGPEAGLLQV